MGSRHTSRMLALQALYALEMNPEASLGEVIASAQAEAGEGEVDRRFLEGLVQGAWRHRAVLDRTEAKERKRPPTAERRGKDWRPGGEHKDPKARFELTRDQKRAKFKRNLIGSSAEAPIKAERQRTSESRPKGPIDPFGRKPRQT